MTPTTTRLGRILEVLEAVAAERLAPPQALARLQPVREADPDAPIELVWEREAYDGRYHYDALLPGPRGTVSLAFCPDDALPWPLRGVRRWSDGDVVRVNETVLTVLEVLPLIDFVWEQERLTTTIVNACLLHEEVARAGIQPTDEQLQAAFDRFRERRGLLTAAETHAWLARHGYQLEHLEHYMLDEARVNILKERIAGERIEAVLDQRLSDFDLALFAHLDFDLESDAAAVIDDIRGGRAELFALATERCSALRASNRGGELPFTKSVLRCDLPAGHRQAVFQATAGDTLGPLPLPYGYRVLRLLGVIRAARDDDTRDRAKRVLLDEWLAERRAQARIEWQWGREEGR